MQIKSRNVTAEEAKKVEKLVRKCVRHLKKKEYELNLPKGCIERAVKCLEVKKVRRATNHAGANIISMNLGYWQIGNRFHIEYASFNNDPVIGKIQVVDNDDHLLVSVAHEVAHHIQFLYAPRVQRFKQNWRKPHGDCFKMIYRYLRRDLVNPEIQKKMLVEA